MDLVSSVHFNCYFTLFTTLQSALYNCLEKNVVTSYYLVSSHYSGFAHYNTDRKDTLTL